MGWTPPVSCPRPGNVTSTLANGKDYGGATGITTNAGLAVNVGDLATGYDLFENPDDYDIDFLLMGSGLMVRKKLKQLLRKLLLLLKRERM